MGRLEDIIERDRASLAARFPALFRGGFVSVARLLVPTAEPAR